MPTIQVKNVPPEVHSVLSRRAAAAHQSLQAYVLEQLRHGAESPTLDEVLDGLEGLSGGALSVETAVETLREDRARR